VHASSHASLGAAGLPETAEVPEAAEPLGVGVPDATAGADAPAADPGAFCVTSADVDFAQPLAATAARNKQTWSFDMAVEIRRLATRTNSRPEVSQVADAARVLPQIAAQAHRRLALEPLSCAVVTTPRSRRGRQPARPSPTPRKLPRNARASAAYDAMLIAAERVLAEHGIAALTTNRIAEVAGVSIGSLYQYFPNKEAIAAALIDRHVARYIGTATQLVSMNANAEPMTIVTAIGIAVAQVFRDSRPVHRHLRDLRAAAGKLEPLDRALDALVDVVAGYLRTRRELDLDPDVAAFMIVHAVDGTINALAVREQSLRLRFEDADKIGRELARMLASYLRSSTR